MSDPSGTELVSFASPHQEPLKAVRLTCSYWPHVSQRSAALSADNHRSSEMDSTHAHGVNDALGPSTQEDFALGERDSSHFTEGTGLLHARLKLGLCAVPPAGVTPTVCCSHITRCRTLSECTGRAAACAMPQIALRPLSCATWSCMLCCAMLQIALPPPWRASWPWLLCWAGFRLDFMFHAPILQGYTFMLLCTPMIIHALSGFCEMAPFHVVKDGGFHVGVCRCTTLVRFASIPSANDPMSILCHRAHVEWSMQIQRLEMWTWRKLWCTTCRSALGGGGKSSQLHSDCKLP